MSTLTLASGLSAPPPDPPAYRPFPELARVIRAQSDRILDEWRGRTLFSMPALGELTVKEFEDDIAHILSAMADALESNDQPDLRRLVEAAPAHGFHRFMQNYDLADLFAEERVLRRVIVARVEDGLERRCAPDEAAALHSMIDIMLQQGVAALVHQQRQELRRATEVQLRHLTFLSHDLRNNFLVITASLEAIDQQLTHLPQMRECSEFLRAALDTIARTREGMHRLLQHERLRTADAAPGCAPVNLLDVVAPIVKVAASDARDKGLRFEVDIDPRAGANTNADLLTIILQNLIGNAVKHTSREGKAEGSGTVRIQAAHDPTGGDGFWVVSVIDDGPGIPPDQLDRLFNAFERLPQAGESGIGDGFGLGLAIASQAAKLLETTIKVDTHPGRGSTFSFRVPALKSKFGPP